MVGCAALDTRVLGSLGYGNRWQILAVNRGQIEKVKKDKRCHFSKLLLSSLENLGESTLYMESVILALMGPGLLFTHLLLASSPLTALCKQCVARAKTQSAPGTGLAGLWKRTQSGAQDLPVTAGGLAAVPAADCGLGCPVRAAELETRPPAPSSVAAAAHVCCVLRFFFLDVSGPGKRSRVELTLSFSTLAGYRCEASLLGA